MMRPKLFKLVLLGFVALGVAACQSPQPLQQPTRDRVPLIPPRDLVERIQAGENIVFLDVREPQEYAEGHIPGAINVTQRDFESRIGEIDPEALIIPYCNMDFRGFYSVRQLRDVGRSNVALMEKRGIFGWRDLGLPVAGGEAGVKESDALAALMSFPASELPGRDSYEPVAANGRVRHIRISANEWYFDPNDLTIDAGDTIRLIVASNEGSHYLVQPDFEIGLFIPEGEEREVTFVADRGGDFRFGTCEWDGSQLQVMKGRIRVNAAGGD